MTRGTHHLSIDDFLRDYGFAIWQRRTGQPILWKRKGAVLSQEQALALARHEEAQEALTWETAA